MYIQVGETDGCTDKLIDRLIDSYAWLQCKPLLLEWVVAENAEK
jgi:hypothetical protein